FKWVTLPGLPWPQFMAAYQEAMSDKPTPLQISADRVVARSIRALAIAYHNSAAFKALNPNSTARVYAGREKDQAEEAGRLPSLDRCRDRTIEQRHAVGTKARLA